MERASLRAIRYGALTAVLFAADARAWEERFVSPGMAPAILAPPKETESIRCRHEFDLDEIAKTLAKKRSLGTPIGSQLELVEELRERGLPYVWPKAFVASGDGGDLEKRGALWLKGQTIEGELRCGVAQEMRGGHASFAMVVVDVLADLSSFPLRTHAGMWQTLEANFRVPVGSVVVHLVGPDGLPRTVPTSHLGRRSRASFAPDRPGRFTVQVLADVGAGARPILETVLFADVEPYTPMLPSARALTLDAPLEDLLGAFRRAAALPALKRDARLDRIAQAHADAMRREKKVAHALGTGDPSERLVMAGQSARSVGENVAHAASLALAHESFIASPSHRANLLRAEYTHSGIGIAEDPDGSVWVVEMFAADLR